MIRFAVILACVLSVGAAAAQDPGIQLVLGSTELEVGEMIEAQLICTNIGRPSAPEAIMPDALKLELRGRSPNQSSRTTIINGRRSQRVTFTYSLAITALEPGTFQLGPVSVTANGKLYKTKPVTITVRDPITASIPRGDQVIFAELDVRPQSVYVTESYRATLTIGIRKVVIRGRQQRINLLRSVLDERASQLSIFPGGDVSSSVTTLADANGVRHQYELFKVSKIVRAEQVGQETVGPIFLRANYPTAVRNGFFGMEVTRSRRESARAPAVIVEVKGPPEEGRPPTFNGAIGRFTLSVTATPTEVEQGKPVTLTIAIAGRPLEGLAGPNLAEHAELASRFEYTKDELVGDIERGAKVFRRAVFPKQAGEQVIPPLVWSYFDLRTKSYVTLRSDPIALRVDPPAPGSKPFDFAEATASGRNGTSLTVLSGGLSPSYVDADEVLASQSLRLTRPWLAALATLPLCWALITVFALRRAKLRGDVGFARRRRARRHAEQLLNNALSNGKVDQQWEQIASAIRSYITDRFNLPPGELTPLELCTILTDHGLDESVAEEFATLLDQCSAMRFAPTTAGTVTPAQTATALRQWIRRIERGTR